MNKEAVFFIILAITLCVLANMVNGSFLRWMYSLIGLMNAFLAGVVTE